VSAKCGAGLIPMGRPFTCFLVRLLFCMYVLSPPIRTTKYTVGKRHYDNKMCVVDTGSSPSITVCLSVNSIGYFPDYYSCGLLFTLSRYLWGPSIGGKGGGELIRQLLLRLPKSLKYKPLLAHPHNLGVEAVAKAGRQLIECSSCISGSVIHSW